MKNKSEEEIEKEIKQLKLLKAKKEIQEKAKNDLIFLAEKILGYPKFGKIHKEVESFLKTINDKAVILLPRRHLKTTFITICFSIQQIIRNPNIRIFITNERLDNAKSFLREIKSHFEKNETFKEIFGDLKNDENKWTETQIVVKTRTVERKEPTIQVGSVDTSLVSQHFDLIIADDLVSRNNIGTKEQIEKIKQYWKDLVSLLDSGGRIIDIGTRWHFDDLHSWLLGQGYNALIRSCWDEKGEPILPEKFTKEDLLQIKKEIGSYDFSCLYENNPVDPEVADFKRAWFKYIRKEDIEKRSRLELNCFITIDTAISKKTEADFTGIIINYVDSRNNWFLKARRTKIDTGELIRVLFNLYELEKPNKIGIEKTILLESIKPFLDEEQRKRNVFLPIVELEHKQVSKELRIRGLIPRYQAGAIYHIENECEDLEDELLRFPRGEHDDLADALAYQLQIAKPTGIDFETMMYIEENENRTWSFQ
jgi:phage terminase large subunit-like protein